MCIRDRAGSVQFGPLVGGVVAVAVGGDSRHVESGRRQLCTGFSGEHPAELVDGQAAHAVDTGFSSTALLHDDGQAVHSDHDLAGAARGVANETVHGVAVIAAVGLGGLPVSGHVADVDGGSLGGVCADTASAGGGTTGFNGDGDAITGLLVVFCPGFCERENRRGTGNGDGAIWSTNNLPDVDGVGAVRGVGVRSVGSICGIRGIGSGIITTKTARHCGNHHQCHQGKRFFLRCLDTHRTPFGSLLAPMRLIKILHIVIIPI